MSTVQPDTTAERPGPGWGNVCQACCGAMIDWPGMRRCDCGKPKRRHQPFPRSSALIAEAIEEALNGD